MDNQSNDDNPPNDATREREAPSRAEFQELINLANNATSIPAAAEYVGMERIQMGPIRNYRDDDGQDNDEIRGETCHGFELWSNVTTDENC
jgi:hypothetical protein